jgi:hypothetical protein
LRLRRDNAGGKQRVTGRVIGAQRTATQRSESGATNLLPKERFRGDHDT